MSPADAFDVVRSALEKAGIRYAIGGSWASTASVSRYWFKIGDESSEVQWRDIPGIVRACSATLDRAYLKSAASQLELRDLLHRSLGQAQLKLRRYLVRAARNSSPACQVGNCGWFAVSMPIFIPNSAICTNPLKSQSA